MCNFSEFYVLKISFVCVVVNLDFAMSVWLYEYFISSLSGVRVCSWWCLISLCKDSWSKWRVCVRVCEFVTCILLIEMLPVSVMVLGRVLGVTGMMLTMVYLRLRMELEHYCWTASNQFYSIFFSIIFRIVVFFTSSFFSLLRRPSTSHTPLRALPGKLSVSDPRREAFVGRRSWWFAEAGIVWGFF